MSGMCVVLAALMTPPLLIEHVRDEHGGDIIVTLKLLPEENS